MISASDQDIIRYSLDLWTEVGVLEKTPHAQGDFYTSSMFPMQIFHFYVPNFDQAVLTAQSLSEIDDFYKARNLRPMIYAPEETPAFANGEVLMSEVIMSAEIKTILDKLAVTPHEGLIFTQTRDFADPANMTAYNEAFLSADRLSEYDHIYLAFPKAYQSAIENGASFKPWMLKGSKDGETACSVTMLERSQLVGLYNLATRPAHRGQGLARNAIREALSIAARNGAETIFLVTDAHSDLERTYTRMGFTPVAHYKGLCPA